MKTPLPKTQLQLSELKVDVKRFLNRRNSLGSYDLQEELLQTFTKEHPMHDIYDAVEIKVKLLNMFYSTGIQAVDAMAANIMSIVDIDKILNAPKYSKELIDAIATLKLKNNKTRNNYSFATKYCALHQPDKYPIYDSIVAEIFTSLMQKGELPPYEFNRGRKKNSRDNYLTKGEFLEKMRDYDFFVKVYDTFMDSYGLKGEFSYREVDWYLWGSYKDGDTTTEIEKLTQLDSNKFIPFTPKSVKRTKRSN